MHLNRIEIISSFWNFRPLYFAALPTGSEVDCK